MVHLQGCNPGIRPVDLGDDETQREQRRQPPG